MNIQYLLVLLFTCAAGGMTYVLAEIGRAHV